MPSRIHSIPNFEVRSVLLLAALTMGSVLVAHGQDAVAAAPGAVNTPSAPPRTAPGVQAVEAAFQRADTNQDGQLSRQEAARFPAVEQVFEQIDRDQDLLISREEFMAALKS